MATCCPIIIDGFCLSDGSAISLVYQNGAQIGWILVSTGAFTTGPPPAGTGQCSQPFSIDPLNCETDSITVCPPASGVFDVEVVNEVLVRPLDCVTDSVTVCQPEVTANVTSVNASATSVTLLAANPLRKGAIFYNQSINNAFIKFGAVASVTSFTIRLTSNTYYELSKGYTGIIDCIWDGTNSAMRITEFA